METHLLQNNRLHYAEVYASDIFELKNLFLQKFNVQKISENFGIPFLLAKKKNTAVAFASLILNSENETDFVVHSDQDFNHEERKQFIVTVKEFFGRNNSENFRNPLQLKSNIERMINWLND
ncbi:hypothetical protein ACFQO9_13140 [Chryseobacterium zhengzhouense]|uniref:Uncharacterized protein n=1 Tax=Chryseobacterium zhengzhouense TaxID=1636086 RepID=A0ABW2M1L7_9FLAO